MFESSGPLKKTEELLSDILRELRYLREDIDKIQSRLLPGQSQVSDTPEVAKTADSAAGLNIEKDLDQFITDNMDRGE